MKSKNALTPTVMKFLASATLAGATFAGATLTGCADAKPTPSPKGPSAGFVQALQSSSGCLDMEKVSKSVYDAKTERTTLRDLEIRPDTAPLSENFVQTQVKQSLKLNQGHIESLDHNLDEFKQNECKTVSWQVNGDTVVALITSSSATRLELSISDSNSKLIYEITGDNELQLTEIASESLSHDCDPKSNSDSDSDSDAFKESHSVATTTTYQWGKSLAPMPETSLKFAVLIERADREETEDSEKFLETQEADYCSKIKK